MTHATRIAQSSENPNESAVVPSDARLGNSYVRFSTSFRFAVVLTGILFLAIFFTQSVFKESFIGLGIELPSSTIMALNPWMLVLTGALFLCTLAKERLFPARPLVRISNGLVCLAVLIVGFMYVMALFLPFIEPTIVYD